MIKLKDFDSVATGIFLMLCALLALYLAWPLKNMSSVGIGPGYIPKLLAYILLVLGGMTFLHGMIFAGPPAEAWHFRPLFLVLAAVLFFALTIERFGLAIALSGLVMISSAAHHEMRLKEAGLLAAASIFASWLIFIKGLSLSLVLWPNFGLG